MFFGISAAVILTTDLIISTAPPEQAGAASAISETGAELGLALGVAVLGSLATAIYRSEVAAVIPAAASEETTARDPRHACRRVQQAEALVRTQRRCSRWRARLRRRHAGDRGGQRRHQRGAAGAGRGDAEAPPSRENP